MPLLAINDFSYSLYLVLILFWLAPANLITVSASNSSQWIDYPTSGGATMTHYGLPLDDIAACGCTAESTHYPTAALSQMAYGSSRAYGPGCGKCFNLTLLNTFESDPPFYPSVTKSIVIKVTDLCPLSEDGWCSGTIDKTNAGGHQLNFDLAYPSPAIPDDFFPSDVSLYGYTDFGVWNVSYETVDCEPNWAGSSHPAALGSVTNLGPEAVCCPADPTGNVNDTCPSYSDDNSLPPDTSTTASAQKTLSIPTFWTVLFLVTFSGIMVV